MKWGSSDIGDLSGKLVIVTGANSGLGFTTTKILLENNAHVIMASRDLIRGQEAKERLEALMPLKKKNLMLEILDLGSLQSIHEFSNKLKKGFMKLDILINNAGVMAIPYGLTEDNFERQFGINHLGHFALNGNLLPLLLRTENSRIVTVTSSSHNHGSIDFDDLSLNKSYQPWKAYYRSKLANILFSFELQRRLKAHGFVKKGIKSIAVHPGYVKTDLPLKGLQGRKAPIRKIALKSGEIFVAQSVENGVLPILYGAVALSAEGGKYYGPHGPFGLRGYPVERKSSPISHDKNIAKKLWEISEEMTGIKYNFPN